MTRGIPRIAVAMLFAAAITGAALIDGLTHASTRPLATAVVVGLPALVLGVATALSARHGARLFGLAMLVLAFGIVATSGVQPDGSAMTLVALFVVSVLLAAAFLRSAAGEPNRRRAVVALLVPLVVLAGLLTAVAISTGQSASRAKCGVDNCAYAGLGVAFTLGAAFELILLAVIVAALSAGLRTRAGAVLFAVGLNLLLVVAPTWSQYQGVAGVAVGYSGLGLAALPWFMPPRAKRVNVSLPVPEPAR